MPVRYYDETQEPIQAYKDDTSADSEGADRDNSHVAARESGDYPELDSFQDPNVADDPDQAYEDAAGNIEGKFFQYIYIFLLRLIRTTAIEDKISPINKILHIDV